MKKFTKWLALLMAGLMVSATLISCDSGYDWAEEDDEDEDEKQSESSSKYKNLTPEEIWKELQEAGNFTIVMKGVRTISGESMTATYTVTKYGDLLKLHLNQTTPDETYQQSAYFDLKEMNAYQEESDGSWIYEHQEDLELSDLLDDLIPVDLLFDEDSYETYDPESKTYVMDPEAVSEEMTGDETVTGKGEMTSKGSTYTFTFSVEQDDKKIEYTVTVKFTADKVTLPDAEPANKGEANTDQTPTPAPSPDSSN